MRNLNRKLFKWPQLIAFISFIACSTFTNVSAQNISSGNTIEVIGTVVDAKGETLIGASVVEEGTTNGTTTDMDGKFVLKVRPTGKIKISYLGYTTQTLAIKGKSGFKVTLVEDQKTLNEVVVVGYGTQKKATLTGAVASAKGEELMKVSQPSLRASLSGKIPGIRYQQTNGTPGNDGGSFDLRGYGSPLAIVDGVERPFSEIDPNEIESVTVLKDASASVYGFKGANGVIIVKTKRGNLGRPKINYNYSIGLQSPVKNLQMMNAYEYAYFRNEALMNSGEAPKYSEDDLEKYRTGSDPIGHPSTDWYDEAVRQVSTRQQHNLNISGGTDQLKYFFSVGYLTQDGILKSDQSFDRYNFRSNVTAQITKKLSAEVSLGGRMENHKNPYHLGDEGTKVFTVIKSQAPNVPIYANNNKNYLYNSDNNELNPMALLDSDITGHNDKRDLEFNSQLSLNYQIWDGLSANALLAFDYTDSRTSELQKELTQYTYDQTTDTYNPIVRQATGSLKKGSTPFYKTTQQYSLNYKKTFNDIHNVSALALFEWKETNSDWVTGKRLFSLTTGIPELDKGDMDGQEATGNSSQDKYGGLVGRFNYDYMGKYLAEFSFRYDGSSKTSPEHRWGFFPAFSLGWRLSEEPFIKEAIPFMDNFKLRFSWGKTGNDGGLNGNQFMSGWTFPEGNYVFGGTDASSATITQGLKEANLANLDIFWYKVTTTNAGLDASFWNGQLTLAFDYFYRKTTGMYASRGGSLPTTSGLPMPQENLNSGDDRGFELEVGTTQKIGDLTLSAKGNVAFARTKDLYWEQAEPLNMYLNYRNNKTYRYNNTTWGFIATGQFQSYDEIYHSPIQDNMANSTLRPGDIKYKDVNQDGMIDDNDQTVIGKNAFPDMNYGLDLTANWHNFDLDILFSGATSYTQIPLAYKTPFRGPGEGNGFKIWEDRWHKADYNDPNSEWIPGKFPSLRTTSNGNNERVSTFWTTDAYFVRLKSLELGYTIPKSFINKLGLDGVRVYFNAYNLFTVTNVKYTDPEAVEGMMSFYYPQLKTYTFGINIDI